jgi:hypothetical protein
MFTGPVMAAKADVGIRRKPNARKIDAPNLTNFTS